MKIKSVLKKNCKIIIAIAALCFISQGCATMGNQFQFKGAETIQIGKTNQSDLVAQYGEPFRVGVENGMNKWTFGYYQYRLFGSSDTKDLDVTFDKNGVVTSYTYSSSNPEEVAKAIKK